MKIKENHLKKIILEEYEKYLQEQNPEAQQSLLKQNIGKHIKLLRLMRSTLKQAQLSPEVQKMAGELNKAKTADFLTQILDVKDSIPVRMEAILEAPVDILKAIIDEITNSAIQKAKQRLSESEEVEEKRSVIRTKDPEWTKFKQNGKPEDKLVSPPKNKFKERK